VQAAARIICFAAITMAFTATGVKATAIIESSDREYLVFLDNAAGTRYATDQIVLPPGDGRRIQTYYQPGWAPFRMDRSNTHPTGFLSAMASGRGELEVGVSGLVGAAANGAAVAQFKQSFINSGTSAGELSIFYTIPSIELWVTIFGEGPQEAYADATMSATHYLADASELATWNVFQYRSILTSQRGAFPGLFQSADLARYNANWASDGITYDSAIFPIISETRPLAILAPGEALELTYTLLVVLSSGAEQGGQAMIGDPFEISSENGLPFEVLLASPTDVPEPASNGLILAGLLLLSVGHTRQRRSS